MHHWRARKHGPGFPLAVARCRVHGRAFTLYPPAWVPYGRLAIAPAKLDGVRSTGWAEAVFALVRAIADGGPWPWSLGADRDPVSYSGEYAHLDACARLLGLHPDQDLEKRHSIGEVLGLPTPAADSTMETGAVGPPTRRTSRHVDGLGCFLTLSAFQRSPGCARSSCRRPASSVSSSGTISP